MLNRCRTMPEGCGINNVVTNFHGQSPGGQNRSDTEPTVVSYHALVGYSIGLAVEV